MGWYSTHWICAVFYEDGAKDDLPILERVVLVEAFDHEEALKRAIDLAEREQKEFTGVFHWGGGRPAELRFMGIRKVVPISSSEGGKEVTLREEQELTCWEYNVQNVKELENLINHKHVTVTLIE